MAASQTTGRLPPGPSFGPSTGPIIRPLAGRIVLLVSGVLGGFSRAVADACINDGVTHLILADDNSSDTLSDVMDSLKRSYPHFAGTINRCTVSLQDPKTLDADVVQLVNCATACVGGKPIDHVLYFPDLRSNERVESEKLPTEGITQIGCHILYAPFLLAREIRPHMKNDSQSSFTISTQDLAERPHKGCALLSAFYAGVKGLVRGLAIDLAPIRVNSVEFCYVLPKDWRDKSDKDSVTEWEKMAQLLPGKRLPLVEDVGQPYLYLMKDRNATGSVVSSNAGRFLM